MKIYNTLSKQVENFEPLSPQKVRMYSCGPTVYDHIHIGNLSAFVAADTLRRALIASGYQVQHVMNFTDVDDKTIRRSQETYPDIDPADALSKLTRQYEAVFLDDMRAIGNDTGAIEFVRATETIEGMQQLITALYDAGYAYVADDGVYFSIAKYRASGKTYGQLVELSAASTGSARIDNDEYDKESAHDFALWKTRKGNEPAWAFTLDGRNLLGRPGWHIECSVMSSQSLGQPFDIHTGGVDLMFPHHENEIAQSTAGQENPEYAKYFVHNEHLLVEGRKMSKSLGNFYTLRDIKDKGYEPLAFRLMVLQSHYRSQTNFTWEALEAAQNRLQHIRAFADLRFQPVTSGNYELDELDYEEYQKLIKQALQDDLNTPQVLAIISNLVDERHNSIPAGETEAFTAFIAFLDDMLGLQLLASSDITDAQKSLLTERQQARGAKDWTKSDELRDALKAQGLAVRDTPNGPVWSRL